MLLSNGDFKNTLTGDLIPGIKTDTKHICDDSSSYVHSPRRLEDTSDWTSEAGLLLTHYEAKTF